MTVPAFRTAAGHEHDFGLATAVPVTPKSPYRGFAKRLFDIAFSLLVLPPVTLLLVALALLIALDGHSPFYRQERLGRDGKRFRMWKLRTMVPDAEECLRHYLARNPSARAEWNAKQKLRHDPRVTRIGRILRETSLDELPQIINVLRGEMSLVGPRPMMVNQRRLYPGMSYFAMRPGITGYWQTSVRNDSDFTERAGYDTAYFHDLSFATDLRVMRQTIGVVLRRTGC